MALARQTGRLRPIATCCFRIVAEVMRRDGDKQRNKRGEGE